MNIHKISDNSDSLHLFPLISRVREYTSNCSYTLMNIMTTGRSFSLCILSLVHKNRETEYEKQIFFKVSKFKVEH